MGTESSDQKHPQFGHLPLATSGPQECALTGNALLRNPYFNKGSAFTAEERETFKLHGLLPSNVQTLEEQVERAYKQYCSRQDDLAKNTFMTSMKEQNEVLYYRLIQDHLKEMFPVIYTPTEGEAIANYSRLFRRPEGCFLNIYDMDRIDDNLAQWGAPDDIDLIVVSDGEQILGIGDQGVGGILISIAKLVIYTLCAGIHPTRTLPVVLDAGTNNKAFLQDPLYLGLPKPRAPTQQYNTFIDTFIRSARTHHPNAYIHFEDFGLANARTILDKYTPHIACFNDDIQGTGCVTLAALTAALHITRTPWAHLRVLVYGAGTAGTGIADQIRDAIAVETGREASDAAAQIWCVDKHGLLLRSDGERLTSAQASYARRDEDWTHTPHTDLLSIVHAVKPHVLIGTSTQPGAFTEAVIRGMTSHVPRPVIFPLSNPTRLHEAQPSDIFKWTGGKALIATGSPFPPVEHDGETYEVAECNNSVCFPGIGLGAVLCRTRLLSPALLVAATRALAAQAPALRDPRRGLVPDVTEVREVSVRVAAAVIREAGREGLSRVGGIPEGEAELEGWIREQMWEARYRGLELVGRERASRVARGEAGATGSRLARE
ncbi:hypothetical protein EJ05DRAFT_532758 [Pseudovirgaria hyperparasitica]|uniref:Malic enzyme n=1 Tax=Pseudovirgaria hyperparasitica TaxID=470096 RepID=A0A6A6W0M3_9PEZI|nr:uncharacterized protein EJ05DRAFT_532758 [Pseudovirgaria hyperparasitica]KAF2755480.1 hypothetical protein EJ05DRAFT_532758 [Pseudovirgaria hyperparasitica]